MLLDSHGGDISILRRGRAIIIAATKGYADCVKLLMKRGEISKEVKNEALLAAKANKDREIATLLNYFENKPSQLKIRIDDCAKNGDIDELKGLLRHNDLKDVNLDSALKAAAQNDDAICLEALLETRKFEDEVIKDAFGIAYFHGARDCFKKLEEYYDPYQQFVSKKKVPEIDD